MLTREIGPDTLIAARTLPSAPRIAAPTQRAPASASSSSREKLFPGLQEIFPEPRDRRQCSRGVRRKIERGKYLFLACIFVHVGEYGFAKGGTVQGTPGTHRRHEAKRMHTLQDIEVENMRAVQYGKVDRFIGSLA